jgi:UDP-N-acetylmuramoylalanine--D-glutamate ligase
MDVEGQEVVVVGLARSGIAAAALLARRGARVVATDRKPAGQLEAEALSLERDGVRLELGEHREQTFRRADLIVLSPGVPFELPELRAARAAGVVVMAELELGFRCIEGEVAAVTGTKGKSTTTAALGAMLREAGKDVRVGGNIGRPVTSLVDGASADTTFVLEVSSFQLEGVLSFRPRLAVFLNLSADHLDRHPSFEAYAQAKARIFANQTEDDWAIVNADDPGVLALARGGRARVLPFHPLAGSMEGAFFDGAQACLRLGGEVETLFRRDRLRLPGAHLAGDMLAAAAAARLLGAEPTAVTRAAEAFAGVEHVLERVGALRGVEFFNDSKATNVDAALRSVEAFERPLVVILGGRYKGGDFGLLREPLARRGRAVMAIGESRPLVAEALAATLPVVCCGSMAEAVERALAAAQPGDAVLLAPACSSFDMFRDYAERGRAFKDAVRALQERG